MISLCITSFNRCQETIDSFAWVINLVDEVVIVDDCSTDDSFIKLQAYFGGKDKVKVYQNEKNLGCYFNKKRAIELATSEWCILLDSDNILDSGYIATLRRLPKWDDELIYNPSWGKPVFDFRAFEGEIVNKENIKSFIDRPMFSTMLNAQNFFVNRKRYLEVFDTSIEPVTSDSEYFALCWLKAGNSYCIVPGLHYQHTIHENSHYKQNYMRTPEGLHESIIEQLRNLNG